MRPKTVLIGATPNPARYAYLVANELHQKGHEFVLLGIKKGVVAGREILNLREKPHIENVDTVTLYIGPQNQAEWIDYILSLEPRRIIFNPGSENEELAKKAEAQGIESLNACSLVMLSIGNY